MARIASRISAVVTLSMGCTLRCAWRPSPHQRAIVGRHGVIGTQYQSGCARQRIQRLEIADAARGIARLQPGIEVRVAGARITAAVVEWAVDAQHARWLEG